MSSDINESHLYLKDKIMSLYYICKDEIYLKYRAI